MEKPSDEAMVNSKVKLMCSYGGRIQPRLGDFKQLKYQGGDSKLLTMDRDIKFSDMLLKLCSLFGIAGGELRVRYQLPGYGLDILVSVLDDDDVENMMFEYDRLLLERTKAARIRLFLFRASKKKKKSPVSGFPTNPDYLFGFDKEFEPVSNPVPVMDTIHTPLDLLKIPKMVNGTANEDSHYGMTNGARDVYRAPAPVGGAVPGMVNYGVLPLAPSLENQKMMLKSSINMGNNNQLTEEIKFHQHNG